MEISESFRIESKTEVSQYLDSRGFKLFNILQPQLSRQEECEHQQYPFENWQENQKFVMNDDYQEYDHYSTITMPRKSQFKDLDEQFQLFCFPKVEELKHQLCKLQFGAKIGCKTTDRAQQWVEKWAIFNIDPLQVQDINEAFTYKYFCKFWHETLTEIHSEVKFQYLNQGEELIKEKVEKSIIIKPELNLIQLMNFTTYFDYGHQQRFQYGFQHDAIDADHFTLEKWKTDFQLNIYEKQKVFRSRVTLDKKGMRQGKNEYGQHWGEEWYSCTDGSCGWTKFAEEENDGAKKKRGESEHIEKESKIMRSKWQEKHEKHSDYWERFYEEESCHLRNYETKPDDYVVRYGLKEFKNNRNYLMKEDWNEQVSGVIKVERINDDGLGKKIIENYSAIKRGDQLYQESSNEIIDDIANSVMIKVEKGKLFHENGLEWENQIVHDFKDNYETIVKRGKNNESVWNEQWYQKENEMWAKKEGANLQTSDQWREEWYEKRKGNLDGDVLESKCEKWGVNQNEEWLEKWGETLHEQKKEKWSDKWIIDKNSGLKRGENWGHEYDENWQPKHHWVEHWDNQGKMIKRDEYY